LRSQERVQREIKGIFIFIHPCYGPDCAERGRSLLSKKGVAIKRWDGSVVSFKDVVGARNQLKVRWGERGGDGKIKMGEPKTLKEKGGRMGSIFEERLIKGATEGGRNTELPHIVKIE